MIITILLLCIFIVLWIHYTIHYGRKGKLINLIPGRPSHILFGHSLQYFGYSLEELWYVLRSDCIKYYPIYKLWNYMVACVSIRHPDDLEKILRSSKHINKSFIYTLLHPWLGSGLITSNGSKWHERRKILTPTFHFNILKQFNNILLKEANQIIKSLEDINGSIVEDLVLFISHYTLNAICETAMGISLQNMSTAQEQYRQAVHDMNKIMIYRLKRPWFYINRIFTLFPMGRKQTKILKILHGFTEKIIAERKLYHERTNGRYLNFENDTITETNDTEESGSRKKRFAMLDLLIAASRENELNDLDIREEVDTFMFAGHDTTAMAICFALLLLAEHKDIQNQVRDEVDKVMQENDGKLTMTALNNLIYLERCLKETLRLYPSVHDIFRLCAKDVKLQSYVIPSGTMIHLNIFDVHRDPNFWPNPEVFDPDRFLPENFQNRHPYSYLPFSAGRRNCIGQRFAMMEMKIFLAYLVHNFYLEPIDYLKDLRFMLDLVLRTSRPIRMKFVPINRVKLSDINTDVI